MIPAELTTAAAEAQIRLRPGPGWPTGAWCRWAPRRMTSVGAPMTFAASDCVQRLAGQKAEQQVAAWQGASLHVW